MYLICGFMWMVSKWTVEPRNPPPLLPGDRQFWKTSSEGAKHIFYSKEQAQVEHKSKIIEDRRNSSDRCKCGEKLFFQ